MNIYKAFIFYLAQVLLMFCFFSFPVSAQEATEEEEETEHVECGGSAIDRWNIKVLIDSAASTINFTPVNSSVTNLVAISTPTSNPLTYSFLPRQAGLEDKTYTVTATIKAKRVESDHDYHLVLSDGENHMIGEIPDPVCSAAASSTHVNEYIAARNFIDTHIPSGTIDSVILAPVVITGVSFFDLYHFQVGVAPNNLELHPILDIHFPKTEGIYDGSGRILDISVGPNPFSTGTTFKINSKITVLNDCRLLLFNNVGEEVRELKIPVSSKHQIDYTLLKGDLKPGIYIYRLTNSGKQLYEGKLYIE